MIIIEHIKKYKYPILTYSTSSKSTSRSISSHLFWNLEDSAIVHTVSYKTKISYHLLLISFFHKLNLMQDVGHNMLHFHVVQQLPSLHAPVSYLSYEWQWYWAEQTISIWYWSKWNIVKLTQVKNERGEACHTILTTYISKWFKGTVSQ